ncbi:MAG: hypothetical protein QNK11_02925, partial [Legionella sp.]|nr:hypothetical protein [Legionella sp.]
WRKAHPAFHFGEQSIRAWADDDKPGLKTLFIDEANISSRNWSEFEGLFRTPPGIMIDNEYVPLSPEHKVIFAGNPLSYGGERTLPRLFRRHGRSVLFEPLSPQFLETEVLKPILDKITHADSKLLAAPYLKISTFLTDIDLSEVLISPRELRHMALSTQAYCQKNPDANPQSVADYFAYTLSKNLVPEAHQTAFEALWEAPPQLLRPEAIDSKELCVNASNQAAFNALHDALDVRELRLDEPKVHLGGLGGVILEGEAGLGKSELVTSVLCARGFNLGTLGEDEPKENPFYLLPAGTSLTEKRKILKQAFHQGAIVVIDEINSTAMMERDLNELLMGTCDGENAKKPGFLIIGTQNPPIHAGRVRASKALQRRVNQVTIHEYKPGELIQILEHKGLPQEISTDMVTEYMHKKADNDSMCCRDLITRAAQEIKSQTAHENLTETFLKWKAFVAEQRIQDANDDWTLNPFN